MGNLTSYLWLFDIPDLILIQGDIPIPNIEKPQKEIHLFAVYNF